MTQGNCTKFSWVIHKIFPKANNEEKTALDTYFATEKWNIPYPLIYNSYDLLLLLDKLHITNMYDLCLTTFDFTSLYTNISYHDTTRQPS